MHNTRGFTLMELLVVIAIIGILGSIMYPVLARGKEQARQTTCLSNLRQCGVALRMYMDDYETFIPPADGPARLILKKMPTCCPNDKEWTKGCTQEYGLPLIGSYAYIMSIPSMVFETPQRLQQWFTRDNRKILADVFHGSDGLPAPLHSEDPVQWYIANNKQGLPRWRSIMPDTVLYLYDDGHTKSSKILSTYDSSGNFRSGLVFSWDAVMTSPESSQ